MQIYIAHRRKNFHKFWWNEELRSLKEASVELNQMWKAASKPRQGPIFAKRQSCRMQYRKCLREKQKLSAVTYTNDLLYLTKTVQRFGNVGVLNLILVVNAQKLKVVLIAVLLVINLLTTLEIHLIIII